MFFVFQTITPVSKILYACLASKSSIWVHKSKASLSTQFNPQLLQIFCGILQSCRLRCYAFKIFLFFKGFFDPKVLPFGRAVTHNYVSVVFQSEATEYNPHD